MRRESMRSIILYFANKIISSLIGILLVSVYTYYLTPSAYGSYSILMGLVMMLISVFIAWTGSSGARFYDEYKEDRSSILTASLIIWSAMTTLSVLVLIMVIRLFLAEYDIYLLLLIGLLISLSLSMVLGNIIRAKLNSKYFVIVNTSQVVINFLLIYVGLVLLKQSITIIFASGILVNLLSSFLYLIKLAKGWRFKYSHKLMNRIVSYGLPMIGLWGLGWILNISDRYIILYFYDESYVGLYDIAYKLSFNLLNAFIVPLTFATFPLLIKKWNENKNSVEKQLGETIEFYFFILLPATFGLSSISYSLYGTLLSNVYVDAWWVIVFSSFGIMINGITQFLYQMWKLSEETIKILRYTVITVLVNLVLNFTLIPSFGYKVASITTLVSFIVGMVLAYMKIVKGSNIVTDLMKVMKFLIASLIMTLFVVLVQVYFEINNTFSVILLVILGVLLYGILIVLFGEKNMIGKFLSIIKKER
jgi:O-antigen/teichoic acid export membrane protein